MLRCPQLVTEGPPSRHGRGSGCLPDLSHFRSSPGCRLGLWWCCLVHPSSLAASPTRPSAWAVLQGPREHPQARTPSHLLSPSLGLAWENWISTISSRAWETRGHSLRLSDAGGSGTYVLSALGFSNVPGGEMCQGGGFYFLPPPQGSRHRRGQS